MVGRRDLTSDGAIANGAIEVKRMGGVLDGWSDRHKYGEKNRANEAKAAKTAAGRWWTRSSRGARRR